MDLTEVGFWRQTREITVTDTRPHPSALVNAGWVSHHTGEHRKLIEYLKSGYAYCSSSISLVLDAFMSACKVLGVVRVRILALSL
jgi:hypothetical protein